MFETISDLLHSTVASVDLNGRTFEMHGWHAALSFYVTAVMYFIRFFGARLRDDVTYGNSASERAGVTAIASAAGLFWPVVFPVMAAIKAASRLAHSAAVTPTPTPPATRR